MLKRMVFSLSLFVQAMLIMAQTSSSHEFEKEMPLFMDRIKQELTFPLAWGNSEITDFDTWREKARTQVLNCMLPPPPKAAEYDFELIDREQRTGYEAQKIKFNISDYSKVFAYLLIPEGKGPFPAVVLLHDHGAHFSIGKEKMIRPFKLDSLLIADADKWVEQSYGGQYPGDYLASKGYVVIAVDALFWGERGRKEGLKYDAQQAVAANFELLGRSWSAFITYEDMYTADFLASLPIVDEKRVACAGFSMGAYRAWMLSALSDKIKAGAAICWMNTVDAQMSWDNKRNTGGSAYSMLIPGLRNYLDYPHIASVACPKPMLFFNGEKDKLFPLKGVLDAYDEMRKVWESQGVGNKLITRIWDTPHVFNEEMQSEVLKFFQREL